MAKKLTKNQKEYQAILDKAEQQGINIKGLRAFPKRITMSVLQDLQLEISHRHSSINKTKKLTKDKKVNQDKLQDLQPKMLQTQNTDATSKTKKKKLTKNQKALHRLMQDYSNKGVDVSYITIPKTITQKFLKNISNDLEQRYIAQIHDIVNEIEERLYDLPNSRQVYSHASRTYGEIPLDSFYYKAIGMLHDNMQEFGEDYYDYLKQNEQALIENLTIITDDSEGDRIRSSIVIALQILSYNNMSKEMEIVTNNWLESLANYDEE